MHSSPARFPFAFALLGLFSLALVAAACGGGGDGGSDPSAVSAEASSEGPPTDAVTQTDGDTVRAPNPAADGPAAADGDSVGVLYHGTLDNGEVFDSNRDGGQPFRFRVGTGQVIAGFDDAVRGLRVGETIEVRIPPDEAYGKAVIEFPREQAPPGIQKGHQVQLGGRTGEIIEVNDEVVRIENPHHLAGEALTFEIQLVELE